MTTYKKTYTLQDIFGELTEKVQDVAELFDITYDQAFLFFQTNKYKTPSFDNPIPDYIYVEAFTESKPSVDTSPSSMCSTAFCEDAEKYFTYMCNHTFCEDCWQGYICSQVREGSSSINMKCMGEKCSQKLSPAFVLQLLEIEPALVQQYKTYLVNHYMETCGMQGVRWCSAGCGAILLKEHCQCGSFTCMGCGEKEHKPIPCDLLKTWKQITSATDANEMWMKSRTKPCPKCNTPIEKNEGCHHMTCAKCKFHWCWICHADWTQHGYGKPCTDQTQDAQTIEKDRLETNAFLTKINFYFFKQKQAEEQRKTLKKHADLLRKELEGMNITVLRVDQLMNAFAKLQQCLTFIANVAPINYFLPLGKSKDLLQNNVDFFQRIFEETLKTTMEISAQRWVEEYELYRKLHTDCKLLETRQKHLYEFILQIDGELQYKSDGTLEGWGCTRCESINLPTCKFCKKCYACVSHQEKNCVICKNKK